MIEYLFFSGIFQSQNWKKLWCYRLEFSCVYYVFQTSYTAVSLGSQYPRLQVPHWKSKAVERPVHCEFCIIFLMIIQFLTVHQIMICVLLKGFITAARPVARIRRDITGVSLIQTLIDWTFYPFDSVAFASQNLLEWCSPLSIW